MFAVQTRVIIFRVILIFLKSIVRIAVQPALARLGGSNNGMTRGVRVLGGVTISGVIATKCHAAFLTCAQMDPAVADFYALGAFADFRLFYGFYCVEMGAPRICHNYFRLLLEARRR